VKILSAVSKAKGFIGWSLRTSIFLLIIWTSLQSALLVNVPVTVVQPTGEKLAIYASGDEFYNWLHDKAGYTIIQDPDTGYYVYAKDDKGNLVSSGVAVTQNIDVNLRNVLALALPKYLKVAPELRPKPSEIYPEGSPANPSKILQAPHSGTLNNIVIFIRFAGEAEFTDTISIYDNMFNTTTAGYNSMRNYYQEVSYSALTISTTFYPTPMTTVVSYQDTHDRNYYMPYNASTNPTGYSGGDSGTERRTREHTLLVNAVNAVSSQIPVGLNVDGDGDGYVDNVCFVIDGDVGAWANLLWPHQWSLYTYTVNINGKRVYTYNFQLQNSMKSSGVGVLCHEMFHSLGSPDLYHYSYDGLNPVYMWDLMEYDLNPPQHMTSYMKYKYGTWIASIPQITTAGTYSLYPLTWGSNNCYKIASPFSTTEYFVLEYRKKTTIFESSLPGEGLLVIRVNPAYTGNASGPPDEVYIYRPNGTPTVNGTPASANYNSSVGRTAINDTTNPSSFLTNGGMGGLSISNVGAVGNSISFTVDFPFAGTSQLGIKATNASTAITVSPNDVQGHGSGTTDFTRIYLNGQTVTLTAPATSGSLYFSRWYLDGAPYSSSLTASVTMNADRTVLALYGIDLGEAVDNTKLNWWTEGRGWYGQGTTFYSGNDAAQSAAIANSEETVMKTMVEGPGNLSFYWKVSSELNYDFLSFLIDGATQSSISGEVNWQQKNYSLGPGFHTLKWRYKKDENTISGSDAGWVDLVTYTPSVTGKRKDDFIGTWSSSGVRLRNSDTGAWTTITSPAQQITAGDLDGDGTDDLVGMWASDPGIWVKFSGSGWAQLDSVKADWIAVGDMNGDGRVDFLGSWNAYGVYYRDSVSGTWVQITIPAAQVTAGDLDGDGTDDLIGIWASDPGVWVKSSSTGIWAQLLPEPKPGRIATGKMRSQPQPTAPGLSVLPVTQFGGEVRYSPHFGRYEDLTDSGRARARAIGAIEAIKVIDEEKQRKMMPGPGEPGFRPAQAGGANGQAKRHK
jgi:M6 family metalloprotease-like protein